MNRDIEALISGYLDESLSEEEHRELAGWIKADPANARHFARAVMLHDRLQNEINARPESESLAVTTGEGAVEAGKVVAFPVSGIGTRLLQFAAALALMLVILYWPSEPPLHRVEAPVQSLGFASMAHAAEAVFEAGLELEPGQRLGLGTVALRAGLVRLQFDSGVEVTLQGPARYELLGADRTRLDSGLLTATVPPGAEGFRVDTPTAEVTDLGTSFGVRLDDSGASHVSVFDGEVEVAEPASGVKKLVKEGETVRVTREHRLENAEFDAAPYEKVWPIATGVIGSTGAFKLAPPWPRRLIFFSSDEHVFVFPEGYRRRLHAPLRVNISEPGAVVTADQLTPRSIPPGRLVRSFIIQHQPESSRPRPEVKRMKGSITFDRPILGVIVLQEELRDSSGRFSNRRLGGQARRQLEFTGIPAGDRLTLSDDRRTLAIDLAAPNGSMDVLRVIVDARPPRWLARR